MDKKRLYRIKLGLFVIVSFCGLLGSVLWLAGSRFLRPVDHYNIIFSDSVSGLLPGARVEYEGVTIGRVEDLMLTSQAPPRVVVSITVRPRTLIRHDTVASLMGPFVTNILFVQLEGGTAQSPLLEEGGTIKTKERSFDKLQDRAASLSDSLLKTVNRVNQDMLNPQNLAAIQKTLINLSQLSEKLSATADDLTTPQNRIALRLLIANLTEAAGSIKAAGDTVASLRQDAQGTIAELRKAATVSTQLLTEVSQLTRRVDLLLVQNQSELGRLISSLADTSMQLQTTTAQLRSDPAQIVWGNRRPERKIPDK